MRYRKLDAAGDYTFGTGGDFWSNSPQAVAQAILTRLRLWKGEWFLDQTEGTDYENVLGVSSGHNPDAVIKQRILTTPNVTSIETFSSDYDGESRKLLIQATVNTQYGQTIIAEVL